MSINPVTFMQSLWEAFTPKTSDEKSERICRSPAHQNLQELELEEEPDWPQT